MSPAEAGIFQGVPLEWVEPLLGGEPKTLFRQAAGDAVPVQATASLLRQMFSPTRTSVDPLMEEALEEWACEDALNCLQMVAGIGPRTAVVLLQRQSVLQILRSSDVMDPAVVLRGVRGVGKMQAAALAVAHPISSDAWESTTMLAATVVRAGGVPLGPRLADRVTRAIRKVLRGGPKLEGSGTIWRHRRCSNSTQLLRIAQPPHARPRVGRRQDAADDEDDERSDAWC